MSNKKKQLLVFSGDVSQEQRVKFKEAIDSNEVFLPVSGVYIKQVLTIDENNDVTIQDSNIKETEKVVVEKEKLVQDDFYKYIFIGYVLFDLILKLVK